MHQTVQLVGQAKEEERGMEIWEAKLGDEAKKMK